jgi:hypothetical protein
MSLVGRAFRNCWKKAWGWGRSWRLVGCVLDHADQCWTKLDEPPFVVDFDVPLDYQITDSLTKRFKGLLCQQLARDDSRAVLTTYWKNSGTYSSYVTDFAQALNPSSPPWAKPVGQLQGINSPPPAFWSRVTWKWIIVTSVAIFGGAAALIGNFQGISDGVATLAEHPRTRLFMTREEVDVMAKDEFEAEGELRNVCDWVDCTVDVNGFRAMEATQCTKDKDKWPPAEQSGLKIQQATSNVVAGIKPGATERVKITGRAEKPGTYCLMFDAQTRKRTFFREGYFELGREFRVKVWPRTTVANKRLTLLIQGGKRAEMECEFMIGDEYAKGFRVEARLDKSKVDPPTKKKWRDIVFHTPPRFPNDPDAQTGDTKNIENFVQLKWQAEGVVPHKRYLFWVFLEISAALDEAEWRAAIDKVEIIFASLPR